MLLLRKLIKQEDGSIEASFVLTQEQVAILVSYAVNNLVATGLASIEDIDEDEIDPSILETFESDSIQ